MRTRVIIDDSDAPQINRRVLSQRLSLIPPPVSQEVVWLQTDRHNLTAKLKLGGLPKAIKSTPRLLALHCGANVDTVLFLSSNVVLRENWWSTYEHARATGFVHPTSQISLSLPPRLLELEWFAFDPSHPSVATLVQNVRTHSKNEATLRELSVCGDTLSTFDGICEVRRLQTRPWYNRFALLNDEWQRTLVADTTQLQDDIERDVRAGLVRPSLRSLILTSKQPSLAHSTSDDIDASFVPPEIRPDPAWRHALSSRKLFWARAWEAEIRRFRKSPSGYVKSSVKRVARGLMRTFKRIFSKTPKRLLRMQKKALKVFTRYVKLSFAKKLLVKAIARVQGKSSTTSYQSLTSTTQSGEV